MNKIEEQNNLLIHNDNILEKIKTSCNYVSMNSRYVSIDYEKLDEYIKIVKKLNFG